MFGGGQERAEAVAIDRNVDREDRGKFYRRWRGGGNYRRRDRYGRQSRKRRTARWQSMFREPKFDGFSEERMSSPSRGGDVGRKDIQGGRLRG